MADYFANLVGLPPSWHWVAASAAAVIQVVLILALVMCSVAVFNWLERKAAGRIQDRLGPTRVGGRFGWLQSPADGLKLLCKEDLIPADADGMLFRLAPYLSFCASLVVYLALPFATGWAAQVLDVGTFFVLAIAGLEVFGVILGGYASGSKWSLFGAMREAAQVVSYEVPLAMCVVVPVMVAGTMNLVHIGDLQQGWAHRWLIFHDPFTFLTFFVYLTCAVASVNRAPFDLAEAESELVAGFLTEYSGFRWAVFFMAEYSSMLAVSFLGAILFFGGWNGPLPVTHWLGMANPDSPVLYWLGNCLGVVNLIIKGYLGVTIMMWLRWTLPRLRVDQVMTVCLKYCIPLASALLCGAILWLYAFPHGLIASLLPPAAVPVASSGRVPLAMPVPRDAQRPLSALAQPVAPDAQPRPPALAQPVAPDATPSTPLLAQGGR